MTTCTCGGKRYDAVLFDFDMTLADSSGAIFHCTNLLAKKHGLREIPMAEVRAAIGLPIEDSWRAFWGEFRQDWLDYYRSNFRGDEVTRIKLYPNAVSVLKELRESGKKVGVASNRRYASRAVEATGLTPLLDVVIGLEDIERAKPEPDCLIKGFAALGIDLEYGVFVGDTDIDMKTAAAAGVRSVGVTTGNFDKKGLLVAGAHIVLDDLGELPRALKGI